MKSPIRKSLAAFLLTAAPLLAQSTTPPTPQPDWSLLNRPRTHVSAPTTPAITPQDLATRLYIFADDSMMGRRLGQIGNVKGVEYIASELKRLGLKPMGDNGTYFQTVDVVDRVFDSTTTLAAGGVGLRAWTDFILRDQGPTARSIQGVQVIYGGSAADSTTMIDSASAAGKFVIVNAPGGYVGFRPRVSLAPASRHFAGAAGIGYVNLDEMPAQILPFFRQPGEMVLGAETFPPVPTVVYLSRRAASQLLGANVDSVKPGLAAGVISAAPSIRETPPAFPARNVVAMIPGSDPKLRSEFIAIGAHNDHIGYNHQPVAHDSIYVVNHLFRQQGADNRPPQLTPEQVAQVNSILAGVRAANRGASARLDSIANGADDDGSGSVSVLEIAQYFAAQKVKPKRSLLFVWHVGEEEGLFGSEWVTDHPPVVRDSIVTQLNIDMIGRGAAGDVTGTDKTGSIIHGGPDYVQLIGSHRLSTELGDIADSVDRAERRPLAIDFALDANGHPQRIYCRSDHYSYARYGIPIIFFTTGGHADYHQVTDEPQYIDYEKMSRVARYVADIATKVGNLDHAPVVDHPKPDPHGRCIQ